MKETMKTSQDNKQFCAAILPDLSKAIYYICYDLLMAYGFDKKVLKFIFDYLNGSSQKIKEVSSFSSELDNFYGVLQRPILGLMLFTTDINFDLLFLDITSNIANDVDDTTPYKCDQHCDNLLSNLELTLDKIFSWFEY